MQRNSKPAKTGTQYNSGARNDGRGSGRGSETLDVRFVSGKQCVFDGESWVELS